MVTFAQFKSLALSFPEASNEGHFEKISFRIKRKIFTTYNEQKNTATVKLSAIDQDVFSSIDKTIIYPVPNKWGRQGWTTVELKKIKKALLEDALKTAYCSVAPKKLAAQVKENENGK